MADPQKTLKRNFFQRLFGKPATKLPLDETCWKYADEEIVIDLDRAPELSQPGRGIRLESDCCPERVLVIHGDDGRFHAFPNRCTHGKRRLDPVPGAFTVQCCSIGKSTFDYEGNLLAGSAKESIAPLAVEQTEGKLRIKLS